MRVDFDLPSFNNYTNVLETLHHFANFVEGIVLPAYYIIQEKYYNMCYYLIDNIYILNTILLYKLLMIHMVLTK